MRLAARCTARWRTALGACGLAAVALACPAAEPLPVEELAPGVFVQIAPVEAWQPSNDGNVANVGFIVGSRCVAVIDTGGSERIGQRLHAAVQRATARPVCVVINTHAHPDHVLGNRAFAAGASTPEFIAHARLPAALAARGPYMLQALRRDFGDDADASLLVAPTRTVATPTEIDLGDRVLLLQPWPTAHTDHDLTVYDRRTRTLFTGDLLFVHHMPVVDGRLRGWVEAMRALRALDVALVVPGHGAARRDFAAALAPQAQYLEGLLHETRAAIKAGVPIAQAVDTVGRDLAKPWALADLFHRRNVTAAYAELEWED